MPETPETPDPNQPTATPESPAETGAKPESEDLGEKGVAALKAERKARETAEKAARDAAAQLKELQDRDKTEAQRQQDALEEARRELEQLTAAKTRAEVAADKQVPTVLLAGPAGNTPEDFAAFADALIAFRGEQKQTPSSTAIGRANTGSEVVTPEQWFESHIQSQLK